MAGTTADKLNYLSSTKDVLKSGLIDIGCPVVESTTFREMAQMVGDGISKGNFTDNNAVLVDTGRLADFTNALTIKGMCYGAGYWVAIANDSSSRVYCIYSTNITGPWTLRMIASDAIDVYGLTYAGGYFWSGAESAVSHNSVCIIRFTVSQMTSGQWSGFTHSGYSYYDVASDGTNAVGVGFSTIHSCSAWFYTSGPNRTEYYGSGVTKQLIKVCVYKGRPVCITSDGYYTTFASMTPTGVPALSQIASGFTSKCIAVMGDYLVVAGTKSDGTYICYTNSSPGNSMSWTAKKIMPDMVTPLALAYADGQCVLAYQTNSGICFASAKTVTEEWITTVAPAKGLDGCTSGIVESGNSLIGIAAGRSDGCRAGEVIKSYGLIASGGWGDISDLY